ncbi:MAG: amino acid permease [Acidobacteria bacterium]|nr:amino acid permease [Acidobacteriota bacterium]
MPQLVRGLGPLAAASINIANMIGTGVFLKARVMTCNVDEPWMVLAAWLGAALLVFAGSIVYAELFTMMPEAGGEYVVLDRTYGPATAFLYGWTYVVVARGASLAAQSFSAAIFLNIVSGGRFEGVLIPAAILVTVAVAVVNCAAIGTTGAVASFFTVLKVTLVAGVAVVGFVFARLDGGALFDPTPAGAACAGVAAAARGGWTGFGAAMLGAMWGFQGWANVAPLLGELREPARNVPRAFLGATAVVALVYVSANASYFFNLPPEVIASVPLTSSVATEVLRLHLGPAAVGLMAAGMLMSSLGAYHSGFAATMRVPYAMAVSGLFFPAFAKLSARTHVPVRAAILAAVWPIVLVLWGNYDKLTDYATFAWWLFYGLTGAAVLVLRRREPGAERPFRAWGYPVVPLLFVGVTAALLANAIYTAPVPSLAGMAIMAAGLPVYRYFAARRAGRS